MASATSDISSDAYSGRLSGSNLHREKLTYDDVIVRAFLAATVLWGLAALLLGLFMAMELVLPALSFNLPYLAFGRLRPLHTNVAILAFVGNAVFAGIYHSTQRLCKARLFSDVLSWIHFWGWQAITVAAAVTLPLGITTGRAYGELEWPIALAAVIAWLAFAVNFFGTIARRSERYLYVSLWFYIATVVTIPIVLVVGSAALPVSVWKSYSVYAGVQDAFMQSWYAHNLTSFMLTMPFLGMMYYYLPKAANRPIYSYWLSVVQFWSMVFFTVGAGPQQLQNTTLPEWASTLGMLFALLLWMPAWGGMINGLLTLRGAWGRVAQDPVLKFFAVAVTFYGMTTLESSLLAIQPVDVLGHYTDLYVAHMHAIGLGWVGLMIFGMLYYVVPQVFHRPLWSKRLANIHFWLATIAILLTIVPLYIAGLTQGLMWQAIYDHGPNQGQLVYPKFVEALTAVMPMYWCRAVGGTFYLIGAILCGVNFILSMTIANRTTQAAGHGEIFTEPPAMVKESIEEVRAESRLQNAVVADVAHKLDVWLQGRWHRTLEGRPLWFTLWVVVAVVLASSLEMAPMFLSASNGSASEPGSTGNIKPYTPLELLGRDVYIANGCCNCHSQMIRPLVAETKRYGEYSKPGETLYDRPSQWGLRRIGPDLAREGLNQRSAWHVLHFQYPPPESVMPKYEWMLHRKADFDAIPQRMRAMQALGEPYSNDEIAGAAEAAHKQADEIAKAIEKDDAISDLNDKEVVALIAYLNRVGREFAAPAATASSPGKANPP